MQREPERLGEPERVSGKGAEQHRADDDVVEMRHQEQAVVQHEIGWRNGEQNARRSADDEGDHEAERPHHRCGEADAAAIHGEQPVEHLHAGRHGDDHRHDAEQAVDVPACAHREEVMEPYHEGEHEDRHRGRHHRAIAKQWLAGEGGDHLGEDAVGRQREDVNLRMPPGPDEAHEHHRVAAGLIREKVEAEVAVERQHRQRRGEDREGGDDEEVRSQGGPGEHRHAQVAHPRRAHLQDGGGQVHPGQKGADAGDLDRPQVVVDADAGRVLELAQRWIWQPARAGELADHQRHVDEQRAGRGQPEADGVQRRKGDIAHAELQRHDEVHQPDDERHRAEEDHDRAVRREDLVIVLRRQIAGRLVGDRLLRAHQHDVREAADQHDQPEDRVHDADALVIDAGDPFAPEVRQVPGEDDPSDDAYQDEPDDGRGHQRDRLIERDGGEGELAEHAHDPFLVMLLAMPPGAPPLGPGPGASFSVTTCWNRSASTAPYNWAGTASLCLASCV